MARVINRWDPSRNVDLQIAAAEGPLVLDAGDERWRLFAREHIRPMLYEGDARVGYLEQLSIADGADPLNGLRVNGLQYMPDGMTFFGADPLNGEPQPEDLADLFAGAQYRYLTAGHRLSLRGWIGAYIPEHLNVELEVWWGDSAQRNNADARGAWTGSVLSVANYGLKRADHLLYALHGKRLGDAPWEIRGGYVDSPVGAFVTASAAVSPWDGVDSGRFRMLITGGSPAWTVTTQYWDPAIPGWVDIASSVVDLRAYAAPGHETEFFLNGYLFHGATKVHPGVIPAAAPEQDTYFRRVSVSQFEPWVLDVGEVGLGELFDRIGALLGPLPYAAIPNHVKVPSLDVVHAPMGAPGCPAALRVFDDDGGWGIGLDEDTYLVIIPTEDRKLMTSSFVAGRYMPACLSDEDAFGAALPFSYVGRYRLDGLAAWTDERCVTTFGRAGFHASPSASHSGVGLTWRSANGGELVLKYWDGVAVGWLELTAPLRIDEYDGAIVDIGLCWTGDHGAPVGLPNRQLRIVVDGVTVASVLEPALDIHGTSLSSVGSAVSASRHSFTGVWFGGATFCEPTTNTDLVHAFDAEGEGGFENPSFETAATSGQPGEAEGWEWQSFQAAGGWAEFSAYDAALAAFRGAVEGFEGGWRRAAAWTYDDEAARLAATGFTAADVGQAAHQRDIDRNYILTDHSPITWVESAVGGNQGWMADLADVALEAAVFNSGVPSYEGTVEHFSIWGQTWDLMVWSGRPWLDAYNLIPPCTDTLGPFGGPTGFDGWFDHLFSTNLDPIAVESFEEAWGNDPMSTSGGQRWQADTAPGGRIRGKALTFPLTIPPNENRLIILTDATTPAMFSLPAPTYASLASLVVALNALVTAHLPGLGIEFGSWADGDSEGLTFGWDGSTSCAIWFAFATLEASMFKDARAKLGLRSFSPGGNFTGVGIPAWWYPTLPAGVDDDDRFLMDSWSANSFITVTDSVLGLVALENDMVAAVFDSAVPDPTFLERFTLEGWVSPSAVWILDLSAVLLTQAMFDAGAHDREDFLDTEWPDEMFPT